MMRWILLIVMACTFTYVLCGQEREALSALERAGKLIDSDAAASLAVAEHAAAADWSRRKWFWPLMLQAQVKLAQWEAAERLGSEGVKEIEGGWLFEHPDEIADEVRFRRRFAEALEHRNRGEEARAQRQMIEKRAKAALLATEIHEPAPPYLKNAEQHKGKPVIALFWATWCAPCVSELDQLNTAYPSLRDRAIVLAVDADDTPMVITAFKEKHGYAFPTLPTKDAVSTIPQIFVLDRTGVVRFHIAGFDDDGLFANRLEWMVEAISK
jgi:thiol-disulfide isomerase/thioredoxin